MERRARTSRGLGWPWGSTSGRRSRLGWPSREADGNLADSDLLIDVPGTAVDSEPETDVSRGTSHSGEGAPGSDAAHAGPSGRSDSSGPVDLADSGEGMDRVSPGDDVSRETPTQADEQVDLVDLRDESTPLASAIAQDVRRRSTLVGAPLPHPPATRVLTVANQKGGVGKTTSAVNIAAALAQSGMRVLVIDLDPQGNASTALGVDHRSGIDSIYDVLVDGMPMAEVVVESPTVPGLFCAPSTIDLAGAEIELVSLVAREGRLTTALTAHLAQTAYDYVFIDCPPSLGLLTVNAFVAAREVFIPIQCEYYALEGLSQLLRNVELIRTHLNPQLTVSTILLTMFDGRTRLSAQVAEEVREHFPDQTLRTTIPRSVRVSEAPSFGETVMTYDPLSSGALAYLEAASQIAHRGAESTHEGARP